MAVVVKIDLGKKFKSGNRKKQLEAIEIIQERDASDFDHGGNSGKVKKILSSGYLLKVEPTWFSSRWNVVCKKRSMAYGFSVWTIGRIKLPATGMGG